MLFLTDKFSDDYFIVKLVIYLLLFFLLLCSVTFQGEIFLPSANYFLFLLKIFYLLIFRERGREGEGEEEKHGCEKPDWLPLAHAPIGD